ncbi:MAG: EF-hand domain-containing protein [Deltaproteobacteria bacterium]|nr:EF-hand domain-containing protein [Deltaproteobacteria bacterium]
MSNEAGVIAEWEAEFAKAAGSDGLMRKDEFVALLGVKDAFIAARLFARFDEDGRGRIDRKEFIAALQRLLGASEDDRLRFTFELHDVDDSGGIDRSELAEMMRANLRENRMQFTAAQIDDLVERFFARSDTDASGDVSYTEFRAAFAHIPACSRRSPSARSCGCGRGRRSA